MMTHDYSQLFSLFQKGTKKVGNNEQNWEVGYMLPMSHISSLFSIILNYSDMPQGIIKIIENN